MNKDHESHSLETILKKLETSEITHDQTEKALTINSKELQTEIFDSISCGVLAYTIPQNELLIVNNAAKKLINCSENDDPIKTFMQFFSEKTVIKGRKLLKKIEKKLECTGDSEHFAFSANVNENILHIKANIKLLEFSCGQKYVLLTMMDITEQVDLADSLSSEKKSYKDALSNGSEYSYSLDLTEGIVYDDFVTAHGVDPARDFGIEFPISYDELTDAFLRDSNIEFADEGMAKSFTRQGLLDEFAKGITNTAIEYYNPKNDIYIRVNALMSVDDYNDHVMAFIFAMDITEMRRKEKLQKKKLRQKNEKLSRLNEEVNTRIDSILNAISGGFKIVDIDDDYRYIYISDGVSQLQGYTSDAFLSLFGDRVTSNIYPPDAEKVLAEANRQARESGKYEVKYRIKDNEGNIKWVVDRGRLVVDESGRSYYYILSQDVTETEERNHQLSDLLMMQEHMSESLGCGIFAYTIPDRNVLIINQEARKIFDCVEGDTFIYDNIIASKILPDDNKCLKQMVTNLVNPGDSIEYIFHLRHTDGRIVAVKAFTKLLSFENGKKFIISSMIDITPQELMEKCLVDERKQYRDALACNSEAFFTLDITEGIFNNHIISKNGDNITERFGIKLPADYDSVASIWFSPKRVIFLKNDADIIKSRDKLISSYKSGLTHTDIEYFLATENKYYNVQILLAEAGINGHIYASFFIYDTTEEKKEKRKNKAIIYSLGRIYYCVYHFSLWNNTCNCVRQHDDVREYIATKGDLEEFCKIYVEKFIEPEYKERMTEFLKISTFNERLKNTDTDSIEYKRVNLGWCRATLVASERNEDGTLNSVIFAVNIIEEQKKQELIQQESLKTAIDAANMASYAKSEFLANMSHDIRTPMNAIIGMTAIAGTHLDDKERVAECLSKITVSSKHLLGLINEILDMSKIEAGRMELSDEKFNLPELIDSLLIMSMPLIEKKHHKLAVSIHNIEHENVIGDRQRIQQAFMNLMGNAIKYTPDGGEIKFSISEKSTNRHTVGCYEFIFEDNGIGMDKEFVEHIYEPFARNDNDMRVNKIKGTGLGMPITKNIVQMMNGSIKIDSELEKGTKITVEILLKLQNEDESINYADFTDLPILVADDDEVSCETACGLLNDLGMKSEGVNSGKKAVEKIIEYHDRNDDFFAVILDWKMPEMDGIETTKEIRKHIGKDIPIVIISAYDWTDIEAEARAAGANAFLSKPIFKSRMAHLFSKLVGKEEEEKEKTNGIDNFQKEDLSDKRVLLAEDNEINAEIAGEILGMTGIKVEFAENGKKAFDMVSASEDGYYDMVFMDIQMPIMDGYEATRAIRALHRNYAKTVPIIAMTANAFATDVRASRSAGMNEHIAKPLDFNQLYKILKKWL